MSAPLVLALDLSLTSTGVASVDGVPSTLRTPLRGVERLAWFRAQVATLVTPAPDLVVIEDYSYNSRFAHSHELGELGGVIRLALRDAGVRFLAISPASLKRYGCGKGNAGKEEMLAEAIRRLAYTGHSNDEADALWLRAMALDGLGHPVVTMPAEHRKALTKVPWPTLQEPAA